MTAMLPPSPGPSPQATTRPSRGCSSWSARRHAVALCVTLGLVSLLPSCRHDPGLLIIPADRTITRLADGGYRVTEAWLLERFELERGLRMQLERCEANAGAQGGTGVTAPSDGGPRRSSLAARSAPAPGTP